MIRRAYLVGRVRRLFQTLAIRYVDPLFASRHPGPAMLALIQAAAPVVRLLQPNDRWSLIVFLRDWSRAVRCAPSHPVPPTKRIFVFCCYRVQFTLDLVNAMLLAWRGHRVTIGYFPKLRSPIKPPLSDSPNCARYLNTVLGRVEGWTDGRVRCIDLTPYSEQGAVFDQAFLETQVRSDLVMATRREAYDPDEPEVAKLAVHYRSAGEASQRAAAAFFAENRDAFDLVLIPNGSSFENAHFAEMAKRVGLPLVTTEKFAFDQARTMTHGEPFYTFADLDLLLSERERLGFARGEGLERAVAMAWSLLDQRRNNTGRAWGWQYQKGASIQAPRSVLEKLGLEEGGFALVCPNVPFDSGYHGWLALFPSMREWLTQTVRYLLENSDLPVIVRAHPAETRPSFGEERIGPILTEAGLTHDRLVVIAGDSEINTYDLMPLCAFAVVFGSTTGVEIAMHGRPVLAGASVYYQRCGVTVPAADRDAYFLALSALSAGETFGSEERANESALLYFAFHYLVQWPYPYDKPSHISAFPPADLVSSEEVRPFLRTLDAMVQSREEFAAELPRKLDLEAKFWS